jgi:hypothetical protein
MCPSIPFASAHSTQDTSTFNCEQNKEVPVLR